MRHRKSRDDNDNEISRSRRDTAELTLNSTQTNETAFEDYERMYLKNQTLNYIKQIYYYSKFKEQQENSSNASAMGSGSNSSTSVEPPTAFPQTNTTDSGRTDEIYEQLLDEVTEATLSELIEGLKDIKELAERGIVDSEIASLCCPLG